MHILENSLGKFYFIAHQTSPPTFLQIIGWTPNANSEKSKRPHVYIRKVPLNIRHTFGGGEWHFNKEIIEKFSREVQEPIINRQDNRIEDIAIISQEGKILQYRGQKIPILSKNIINVYESI